MIVDELKKSLYLASFQGKLSTHNSMDSDVEESLNKIIMKKRIDNKEIKKRKINDEYIEIYKLPSTWKWVKLGYICDVIRGLTFSSSCKVKKNNTILVLRGGNIDSKTEELIYDDNIYVDSSIPNSNQFLQLGDILVVASSGTKTSVGKSSLIHEISNNVSFGGFMIVIRSYAEVANPKYISYQIKMYRNKIINSTNGYISNITNEILNNLMIPLPPIEEQQRIVDKIEELFAKLDELKPIEEELEKIKSKFPEDMKKSIIFSALSGKLTKQFENEKIINYLEKIKIRDVEINAPFNIPSNWEWVYFGDIVDFKIGKTPPRADSSYWSDGRYNWISIADMIDGGCVNDTKEMVSQKAFENVFKGNITPKGTLIMSFKMSLGKCSILNIDSFHHEGIISIFPKFESDIIKEYLFKVLPFLVKYGDSKNAIKGKTLNSQSLDKLLIPLPPIEEQQRIVDKLEQLLPLCDEIENLVKENYNG